MNKKRKEKQRLRELGVVFVTLILPDKFPTHLLNTFQRIRSFRRFDFSTFLSSAAPEQVLWRSEIMNRAREIAAIAATLIEDATAEMEVRLRYEEKVLKRFNMIIECPSTACKKRLWRSEVEAVVEFPNRIAKSLAIRRQTRLPCQCPPEERSSHLNNIFSSRADEITSLPSLENDSEKDITRRRPDRIFGFQERGSFNRRLEKYNLMAGRPENEAGLKTIQETVESTVLDHKGNALLFPFLIIEAKSRNGSLFEDCNIQSALPILKMLKIQEDLQRKTQMTLEYGGPLVWYIAYRGEDWHLSGCYISEKPSGSSYEIVTLWTGQLNDAESALQLLLIIDYIFDWARDIYRPSLISQLEMLANEPPGDDGPIRNDDLRSRIETDSDVGSLARPKQRPTIEEWAVALDHDTEMVSDEEYSLMKWVTHDSDLGVFRPACIVQNLFRCLFVTKTNIDALFSAVPPRCTVKQLANQITSVLKSYRAVLVSEDVLDMMEEVWTNRPRQNKAHHIPETELYASIVYHTVVTKQWELQRTIFCLAFDREALSKAGSYTTKNKSITYPFKHARRLGKSNTEVLINGLKYQSMQQNLASALASTRQELLINTDTSLSNPRFVDATYVQNGWGELKTHEIIDRVCGWVTENSEVPTQPFLRVSHQWNSLPSSSTSRTVASYFPNSVPATDEQYALVAQTRPYSRPLLCIYVIPGVMEATERLRKTLWNVAEIDVLYKYSLSSCTSNNWKDVYKKWRTTDSGSCQEIIKQFQQWKHGMRDQVSPSSPVALSTAGKSETGPVERPPILAQAQASRSPSSSAPIVTAAESNLKRPSEDANRNDVLTIQKKVKSEIIVIDD